MSFRDLTKRCCLETLYRDRWQRLTTKILAKGTRVSCSGCRRCPYKGILHSIFCRNPAEEILRTIFHWYLHKGNLQGLPWHLFVMFSVTLFGAYCRFEINYVCLLVDILLTSAYVLFSSSSWALPVYFAILCLAMHCHMAAEVRFFDVLSISYLLHSFVHRLALKAFSRLDQLGPLFSKTGQEIIGAITRHIKAILRRVTV